MTPAPGFIFTYDTPIVLLPETLNPTNLNLGISQCHFISLSWFNQYCCNTVYQGMSAIILC